LKVIYGAKENWINEEWKLNIIDANSDIYIKDIIRNNYENSQLNSIEIETINRCNNDCSFCPVSVKNDIRNLNVMNEKLFYQIIDELSDMKYTGYISIFSNNEPLLDKRLITFLTYAREKLPYAKHALCTNGLLINEVIYKKLINLLDYLVIDNYNDDFEINDSIKKIMDIDDSQSNCDVTLSLRKKNQILLSRGGNSPNKKNEYRFKSGCVLPFFQMIIRPDGKVSMCCQDAYGEETLGDVSIDGIRGVWNSDNYNALRKSMISEGRTNIRNCSKCDLFGLNNYYDPKWISNYTTTIIKLVQKHITQKKKIILVGSYIESDSYIDFFRWNGIHIDSVVENVEQIKPGNFYIFMEYFWNQLELFRGKCIGKDYVIFLKPNNFEYEHKMLLDSNQTIKCIELILKEQTKDNLVFFGTGHNSEKLVKMLSLCPKFYVDNDVNKQGNEINGKKVFGVEKIYNNSYFIVVTPSQDETIIKQLLENGIERKNIVRAKYLINKF
jgi:radical SAM protein with 4Fe4S-binding SPASM domain